MRGIMEGNKVSIGEFLNIAGVKLNTVKKNAEKIPGLKYENGDFDILSGTRYPGDFPLTGAMYCLKR